MNPKATIAALLSLWVVVMPASAAAARPGSAGRGPAPDPEPVFHAAAADNLVRGRNGVEIATSTGHFHQGGEIVRGGRLSAAAPWGEVLDLRYFADRGGFLVEIDDHVSTLTRVDEVGNAVEYVVRLGEREVVIDLAAQSRRMARGGPAIEPWEAEGYQLVLDALLAEHSPEFWDSLVDIDAAAPAGFGCIGEYVDCLGAVLAWLGSLSALASLCGGSVASAGALTPACLLAIITHPVVSASAALQCAEALECSQEEDPHGDCGD